MKFRRVLVTTALVMILASSLFSGWLASSPMAFKPPVAKAQGLNEYQSWFNKTSVDTNKIGITIDSNPNTPVDPPIVYIPAGISGGPKNPSPIKFKLAFVKGNGLLRELNAEWLIFRGYQVEAESSGSETLLPNLYLLVNDNRESIIIYSASTLGDIVDQLSSAKILATSRYGDLTSKFGVAIGAPEGKFHVKETDIRLLFRYIFNAPKSTETSCAGLTNDKLIITGPAKSPPILPERGGIFDSITSSGHIDALGLDGDCLNVAGDGWLQHWGVQFQSNPIESATCGLSGLVSLDITKIVTRIISCAVGGIIKSFITPVQDVAKSVAGETAKLEDRLKDKDHNDGLVKAWRYSLSLINVLVILALLVIAFANVLHLNLNTYAAKKALPGIVLGVIGANASMLLMRFILDIVQALMNLSYQIGGVDRLPEPDRLAGLLGGFINILGSGVDKLPLGSALVFGFALFIIIIGVLYFLFLVIMFSLALIKRTVMLYFLIVLAPLAFVSYGIPTMSQWFAKWWDQFLRNAFVLPILFLAIAIFIKYSDQLGLKPDLNALDSNSPGVGLFTVILVFAAATLILKLPGAITKGAIDLNNISKKAFGAAKQAPASMWGVGQGIASNKAMKLGLRIKQEGEREKKARAAGNHYMAGRYKAKREELEGAEKRWKVARDATGAMRGRAYGIANPDKTFKPWWEARLAVGDKAGSLEASKLNVGVKVNNYGLRGNVSDIVSGRAGGYIAKLETARKLVRENVSSLDEAMSGATSKDLMKAVLDEAADIGRTDKVGAITYLEKVAGAKKPDDMTKIVNDLATKGYKGVKGQSLFAEGDTVARIEYITTQSRRNEPIVDERFTRIFDAKTRAVPFGGAGGAAGTTSFGGGGAQPPDGGSNGGVQRVNIVGQTVPLQVNQATFDNRLSQVMEHAQSLKDNIGEAELAALADHVIKANTPDSFDADGLKNAIKGVIDPSKAASSGLIAKIDATVNPDDLAKLAHDFSLAVGNGESGERTVEAISQRLAGAYGQSNVIEQHNQDIASRLDEQKLAQIMNGSLNEAMTGLQEVLGGNLDQINETLKQSGTAAKDRLTVLQKMVGELQGMRESIGGRGKNTLRSIVDNMGLRLAKNMGVAHLSIGQQIRQAATKQPDIIVQQSSAPSPQNPPVPSVPPAAAQKPVPTVEPPPPPTTNQQ